ncbi:hypothetical protein D8B46_04945 [Candidatus Gracilibacteria bacterium]|nr:MAG: hypothetical protein D8B46_04945 [Candidatus Gracilibacteria bacterium]
MIYILIFFIMLYIDVGSSTVKIYKKNQQNVLSLEETKSFHFKKDFDSKVGLNQDEKNNLINYLENIKQKYKNEKIKIFATAFFRKMEKQARQKLIDEVFEKIGLFFNIISHNLESFYLEEALSSEYTSDKSILLINIGGGSTELIIKEKNIIIEKFNLDIGVGTILKDFPNLNLNFSEYKLEEVVNYIKNKIPDFDKQIDTAIYNGGELTYMKLVGYSLEKNTIFEDKSHPFLIKTENFRNKNNEVFKDISIKELENLMPKDPLWMHGARACSAIAQAVLEKFGVKYLIPSDSNTIDGVVKKEFRKVTLSGSFRKHLDYITDIKNDLMNKGYEILSPKFHTPKNPGEEFVIFEGEEGKSPLELERNHLKMIEDSDALIVCNQGGYVGASALIEIGYANALGKRIIFTEKPEEFMLQTLPSEVGY